MQATHRETTAMTAPGAEESAHWLHIPVPAAFIVQLAAGHAGIGPYSARGRATPAVARACYQAAQKRGRQGS